MARVLARRVALRPARGAVAVGCGLAMAAGQAPLFAWWLAFPALVALTALIAAEPRPARAAWLGWLAGSGYFAAALFWIVEPFFVDAATYGWMAPFALVFTATGFALFWMAAAAGAAWLGRGPRGRALALAVTLAAAGMLRGYLFTGFPWALIGHLWIGLPQMQLAAIAGPHGLTLLATLAAALPLALPVGPGRALGAALALVLVAGTGLWGAARLAAPLPDRPQPLTARLVQPNAAQRLKWRPDMIGTFLDRKLGLTAAPASGRAPDVVIWPETSLPYPLGRAGATLARISEAAGGTPVILGALRFAEGRRYNSLVALGAGGHVTALYDKHHLVPFGEYLPLGGLLARLGLHGLAAGDGAGYAAGPGPRLLDLGPRLGTVLPLICYEAIFPRALGTGGRADWIVQITNDAWFGRLSGPYQHLAQARLRAVEQGLPLLRAANTGVSAAIGPKGRVTARLGLGRAGKLDAAVPPALPPTPYARSGDGPPAAFLALCLAALTLRRWRGRGNAAG